jgi:hypothetical protein
MEERRQFLADLVRVNPRDAMDLQPHLVQQVTVTRRTLEDGSTEEKVAVKLGDKLKAIQLDAVLAGEYKETKVVEVGQIADLDNALERLLGLTDGSDADDGDDVDLFGD